MQIKFITHREPTWLHPDIKIQDSPQDLIQLFRNSDLLGGDTENTSLNPIYARPLLSQFSDGIESYVLDRTTVDCSFLKEFTDINLLTFNGQYDYMIWKYHYQAEFRRLNDLMINEQIIGRGSGRMNNLDAVHFRRLGIQLPLPKSTRNSFTKMGKSPVFEIDHVIYSAYDPYCLFKIYEVQKPIIEEYKLEKRVYEIAHPLISLLGDMCLEGFTLDEQKWLQILRDNKNERYKIECQLDDLVREFSKNHLELRGGKWTRKRYKTDGEQVGLFGDNITVGNENKANISYGSIKQLKKLFVIFKEPVPQIEDKNGEQWGATKDSFGEPALEQYKIEYPNSRMIPFINLLLKYAEVEKEINSFGEKFLKDRIKDGKSGNKFKRGYLNSITGKVHTSYKQEFTANGRLSSGEGEKKKKGSLNAGFYNSQQIPKKNKYRNSFTLTKQEIDKGILISTDDLSQAELVILASHSQDPILMDIISNGKDLHNHLSTNYYTKIIKYILETMSDSRAYDEIAHLLKPNRLTESLLKKVEDKYILYNKKELEDIHRQRIENAIKDKGIIVDKKLYPDIRDPAKNVHYGITYGAEEAKIAKTLNIASFYGGLAKKGIYEAIPKSMAFLDRVAREGVRNGYIVFNNRTNSRHWFKTWLDSKATGRELNRKQKGDIERFCKNASCSGTQADMIKEAMVEVYKFVQKEKVSFKFLLQVHDEIVYMHEDKDLRPEIERIMADTCNKYLTGVTMKVSGYTGTMWNKD